LERSDNLGIWDVKNINAESVSDVREEPFQQTARAARVINKKEHGIGA
jgi:hypothetical protein